MPGRTDLVYYAPHSGSGLGRITGSDAAPYWAWPWSGGLALARYLADHPGVVAGKRVLDFGCGSGLVAMCAASAGAAEVVATDIDPFARAAAALNADANNLAIAVRETPPDPAAVDLVLAGDVFYDPAAASSATDVLDRFRASRVPVLVGDPRRLDLPLDRLAPLAQYDVAEFGGTPGSTVPAAVFAYRP